MQNATAALRSMPKYEQIASQMRTEIRELGLSPSEYYGKIDDVCEKYQVSKITAQRAVHELVEQSLLYTKKGNGIFIAAQWRRQQAHLMCLLFSDFDEESSLPLVIRGIEAQARLYKYDVMLCNGQSKASMYQQHIKRIIRQGIDGVLLDLPVAELQGHTYHGMINELELNRIPVVLIQKRLLDVSDAVAYVVTDNFNGTMQVVEHLCKLGHKRIAGVLDLKNPGGIERLEGYRGALLKHGGALSSELIKSVTEIHECDQAIDELLALALPPTAIFCVNDLIARRVIDYLRFRGLMVPGDVAVVGFDDLPISRVLTPQLTTVHQPLERLGREAVTILHRRLTHDFNYCPQVRLPAQLIIRESCGTALRKERLKSAAVSA